MTENRLGRRVEWIRDSKEEHRARSIVDSLLARPMTAEDAVTVALLNNRALQAEYERLGVEQAAFVQAGLPANPVVSLSVRISSAVASVSNIGFGVAQNMLDLLMLPARKGLASAQFEAAKHRTAHSVLYLATDTQSAYYALQGSMNLNALLQTVIETASTAAEFARRQHEAGNIGALELTARTALYEQTRIDLIASETAVLEDRERLVRLMGLSEPPVGWHIPDRLPDLSDVETLPDRAESLAVAQRLDLAALHWEIDARVRARSIAVTWRYFPLLDVGVETEREIDGERVTGPHVEIALPVFDRGQARTAAAEALLRESRHRLAASATEIRSEVRVARNRLLSARTKALHYRKTLIPLHERLVTETGHLYNFMLAGVYQLLQAKRDEIGAYQGYIAAVRDYWIARCEWERVMGGRFDVAKMSEPPRLPER